MLHTGLQEFVLWVKMSNLPRHNVNIGKASYGCYCQLFLSQASSVSSGISKQNLNCLFLYIKDKIVIILHIHVSNFFILNVT